ncbi:hypothetical protein L6J37_11150 [Photobacterium sp. WH77]|uniref:hypothetical protein n=1 Tax=unclassified Photobacterium TaxID=2628852 RepID=UPI001EDAC406|nr:MULTISPECIES: hypothetical protein [unclassified Photobacterium]MCG2837390.1 hypothetical protein [Photobacterium sp. WH77]MCG2845040.1 hypothetical protein [Photobacterium sp. WH80]
MRKSLFAVAVTTAILSGCGGSDSGNNDDNGKDLDGKVTVQVIDGYLSNAQLCVDRNRNAHCNTGELLTAKTNGNGQITISASDSQYPLIARVIAGESSDSDHPGFVWQDAELYAPAGQTILTPFSTLAYLNDLSLADYAASLNLDASLLNQDYVALKSSNPDAKKVHLYARTMNAMLGATLSENDLEGQKIWIQNLKNKVQELENNHADFDAVTLTLDKKSGQFSRSDRVKGIQPFLEGNGGVKFLEWLNASIDIPHKLTFTDGKITSSDIGYIQAGTDYQVSGTSVTLASQPETKIDFVYVSPDIALGYVYHDPSKKFLTFWQSEADYMNGSTDLAQEDFTGKIWYLLRDAAGPDAKEEEPPVPELNELVFLSATHVSINPMGADAYEAEWGFTSDPNESFQTLTIQFSNNNTMILDTDASKAGVTLLKQNIVKDNPQSILMTQNKALAKALHKHWQ